MNLKRFTFEQRRGIPPETLLGLVKNTAPFLFETTYPGDDAHVYLRRLQDYKGEPQDHRSYYLFGLCAHWATAGTFVPTDVDNAIRLKLWEMAAEEGVETLHAMADWTVAALRWDYRPVTKKLAVAPSGAWVSTHEGTWFSVAVGAYAALKKVSPAKADEVLEVMHGEAVREDALWQELLAAGDGLEILRASALLAHNFGDLDRVVDMWRLPPDDDLRRRLYDAAHPKSALFGGRLAYAGAMSRRFMAADSHRYFALREPRFLRRSADFLLPIGPFLDGWGNRIASERASDVAECVGALLDGVQRTPGSVAYARALAGILEAFPGGLGKLENLVSGRDARLLRAGTLRAQVSIERVRFEAQWSRCWRQIPPPAGVAAGRKLI